MEMMVVVAMLIGYAVIKRHRPGAPIKCPACSQIALVEMKPSKYTCGSCTAAFTRVGVQWVRNEDHVPVARLK